MALIKSQIALMKTSMGQNGDKRWFS